MPRVGSLVKLGGAWVKRKRVGSRMGGKTVKWYPDDPLHVRSKHKSLKRPDSARKSYTGSDREEVRMQTVRRPVMSKPRRITYSKRPQWLREEKRSFKRGGSLRTKMKSGSLTREYSYPIGKEEVRMQTVKVRKKARMTGHIGHISEESRYNYAHPLGRPDLFTIGEPKRSKITGKIHTTQRPDFGEVKPQIKPTRIQAAMIALRKAEAGLPDELQTAGSIPASLADEARELVSSFEPAEEVVWGRLKSHKGRVPKDETVQYWDYPIEDAELILSKQAELPEHKRTVFPETKHVPSMKVLRSTEGGTPVFERRVFKRRPGGDWGASGAKATEQVKKLKKKGLIKGTVQEAQELHIKVQEMWKAMGGNRSAEAKKWERLKGSVFFGGTKKGKVEQTAMNAFTKVALEYIQDPKKATKRYPPPLILSLKKAYEMYRLAKGN